MATTDELRAAILFAAGYLQAAGMERREDVTIDQAAILAENADLLASAPAMKAERDRLDRYAEHISECEWCSTCERAVAIWRQGNRHA